MVAGTITNSITQAIQFGQIKGKEDVVGIKALQEHLNKYKNIDIEYSSLKERVQDIYDQREN